MYIQTVGAVADPGGGGGGRGLTPPELLGVGLLTMLVSLKIRTDLPFR